ncbi:MAG TPA: hypothetical protein VF520_04600 [Thermoleophilaceae bacterium]|jgi:hypothetical protein
MKIRFLAGTVAACVLALAATAAQAAPIKVNVRVEGVEKTLFEGNVMTEAHDVTGDASGPHKCDGTNGGANSTPGPTLTGAFDSAMHKAGIAWSGSWSESFEDFLVDKVGPDAATSTQFWGTVLNFKDTDLGGCQQRVEPADQVLVAFDSFGKAKLRLSGEKRAEAGERFALFVLDGLTGKRVKGATVGGKRTSSKGRVLLRISRPGVYEFKAAKSGTIRSNRLRVRVR